MSLNVALSSAVSSLLAIERQMSTTSNNIANASTAGYTEKTATTVATSSGGVGTGVEVTAITSMVDQYLLKNIAKATSSSSYATTFDSYYTTLQNTLGTLSSTSSSTTTTTGSDLSSLLTNLESSLSSLANTPDSTSLKTQVVTELSDLTSSLRTTSKGVQSERAQADQDITTTVADANTQLTTISQLNTEIQKASSAGESTADLKDKQMTALDSLSKDLGVSYFIDGTGKMQVYTASGQSLLDSTNTVHSLSHTSAASVSSTTVYSSTGTSGFDGITVSGTDITGQITSGKIGALINQRDTQLPNVQAELDNLASTLATTINSISNLGSADPPPNSLTGSTTVATGDAVTVASGTTIRVAITDSTGNVMSTQDVNIGGATTVGAIATDLASAGVTATVTNGHLVISAPTGSGVALSTLSGSVGGTNLSQYFGLNDLVSNGSSAMTIEVRSDIAANPSLIPTGQMSSTLTVGSAAIGASSATLINELADSLTNSQSFSAAGALGTTSSSLSSYAASIISDIATKSSNASTAKTTAASTLTTLQTSFSSQSGVNTDNETANLTALQNAYAASAQVITAVKAMFTSLMTAVQA